MASGGVGKPGPPAVYGRLCARIRARRLVVVLEPFRICAAVAFELGFDPVDGLAVAVRSLAAVAELRQPLDGGLVAFQIEAIDENFYGIGNRFRLGGRSGHAAAPGERARDGSRQKSASHGNHLC